MSMAKFIAPFLYYVFVFHQLKTQNCLFICAGEFLLYCMCEDFHFNSVSLVYRVYGVC